MALVIPSQELVLINIGMIGLGLLIAVYTLVYPKIEEMMEENARRAVNLERKFEQKRIAFSSKSLSKDESDRLLKQINEIKSQIDEERVPKYELFLGFIIPIVLFSIPLIKTSLDVLGLPLLSFLENGLVYFTFGGILLFVLNFILIIVRLHSIVMDNFDKKVKTIREETDEGLKRIREIREALLEAVNTSKKKKRRKLKKRRLRKRRKKRRRL